MVFRIPWVLSCSISVQKGCYLRTEGLLEIRINCLPTNGFWILGSVTSQCSTIFLSQHYAGFNLLGYRHAGWLVSQLLAENL